MKKQWHLFKLICVEVTEYNRLIWIAIFLHILLAIILPFAQLLLSAQVIQWLTEGIAISDYLKNLAIFLGVIILLTLIQSYIDGYLQSEYESFRIRMMTKVGTAAYWHDFPWMSSEEGQKAFSESLSLSGHTMSLFGRFLPELGLVISSLLSIILYSYLLTQIETMFLLIIAGLVIGLFLFKKYERKLIPAINEKKADIRKKIDYLSKVYSDSRFAKDIRLYRMREWFIEIRQSLPKQYRENLAFKNRLQTLENIFVIVGMMILTGLAFIRNAELIARGELELGSFVIYVGAVTILASNATQFVNHLSKLDQGLLEAEYYDNFINHAPIFNHGEGPAIPRENVEIELRNLSYTYPGQKEPIIKNISAHFKASEKIAIVGENGAGKTTLIKLITGLLYPDEGEILINGKSHVAFNIYDYYDLFSVIFQDNYLLTYSIRETVLQGIPYDEERYQRVLIQSGLDKIIEKMPEGDETKIVRSVYSDGVELSGGQLQKLKLAQALYKDAPVLILDEPTAALDPIAEHQVYQDYLNFSKDKLSIFISHRLSSTRFCDRIIYLKDGQITEEGSHEELLAERGNYHRLYQAQAYYYQKNLTKERDTSDGGDA